MDYVQPAVPAYAQVSSQATVCAAEASRRYDVPELLLHAIIAKEGGRSGQWVKNTNGSYDLGLSQINTSWATHFRQYGIRLEHLASNDCTNIAASAYILKYNLLRQGNDWFKAIMAYHTGLGGLQTREGYRRGYYYAKDVVGYWWGFQRYVESHQVASSSVN